MAQGLLQIAIVLAVLVAAVPLLGGYMARVFTGERVLLTPVVAPVERFALRRLGVRGDDDQTWKQYARSLIVTSALFWVVLYLVLRTQTLHPGNGKDLTSGTWDLTFNTVSSFVTNTNWQSYGGETTLTNVSQAVGLTVQNFVSAGVGIAVAIALTRAIASRRGGGIGSFHCDLVRALLYVLLPLSLLGALLLASQGVVQTLATTSGDLTVGPVASQEAIKLVGTNGGGFFNVNSAFPFENPTQLSNVVQMLLILAVPASLTSTFGRMVGSRRQGWAIFGAMSFLFLVSVAIVFLAERHGTSAQQLAGVVGGGNMEGKEVRFGTTGSALYTAITTVVSCGAVNAALDSLTALGGFSAMLNLGYSESVFGGVGTGLYTMLTFVLLAVFLGGLMVGRTPEYLGKKIEAREIRFVAIASVFTPLLVLGCTALAVGRQEWGGPSIFNAGPQGFSETFYAYLSQGSNNGSAFAGFTAYVQPDGTNEGAYGITFAQLLGGLAMLLGRFVPILLLLAVAGSLSGKAVAPAGLGTMRTDTPTFVVLLIGVVVLLAALTFVPAFLLGPIVQSLTDTLF